MKKAGVNASHALPSLEHVEHIFKLLLHFSQSSNGHSNPLVGALRRILLVQIGRFKRKLIVRIVEIRQKWHVCFCSSRSTRPRPQVSFLNLSIAQCLSTFRSYPPRYPVDENTALYHASLRRRQWRVNAHAAALQNFRGHLRTRPSKTHARQLAYF